jgi:hypothetical protein
VPAITKAWMMSLDDKGYERVVAILRYCRIAEFLSVEAEDWFDRMHDSDISQEEAKTIFWELFIPAFMLFASMLMVLHEGLNEIGVEDRKLQEVEARVDMRLLQRFRNATFHFQPQFRSPKHSAFIAADGFETAWELWKRQSFLIHKMRKLLKHHPRHDRPLPT